MGGGVGGGRVGGKEGGRLTCTRRFHFFLGRRGRGASGGAVRTRELYYHGAPGCDEPFSRALLESPFVEPFSEWVHTHM